MDLTDAQWERVDPLIPNPPRRQDSRGRPRRERREVLAGVLWILRTGAQWAELPRRYPPYQTCHRYFQQWCRDGTLRGLLHALAQDLHERGEIDISEAFIDGTFAGAKKGALLSGRLRRRQCAAAGPSTNRTRPRLRLYDLGVRANRNWLGLGTLSLYSTSLLATHRAITVFCAERP